MRRGEIELRPLVAELGLGPVRCRRRRRVAAWRTASTSSSRSGGGPCHVHGRHARRAPSARRCGQPNRRPIPYRDRVDFPRSAGSLRTTGRDVARIYADGTRDGDARPSRPTCRRGTSGTRAIAASRGSSPTVDGAIAGWARDHVDVAAAPRTEASSSTPSTSMPEAAAAGRRPSAARAARRGRARTRDLDDPDVASWPRTARASRSTRPVGVPDGRAAASASPSATAGRGTDASLLGSPAVRRLEPARRARRSGGTRRRRCGPPKPNEFETATSTCGPRAPRSGCSRGRTRDPATSWLIVGGSTPRSSARIVKIASTAPAAPRQWPVAPFVEETGVRVRLLLAERELEHRVSAASPSGVEVPWALT